MLALPWSTGDLDEPDAFAPDRLDEYADKLSETALEFGARRLDMWRATISAQVERDLANPPSLSPSLQAEADHGMDATGSS